MNALQRTTILAFCLIAFACRAADDKPPHELVARPAAPDGTPTGSPPSPPANTPGEATPPAVGGGAGGTQEGAFVPPPESCDDNVELGRECWTEKFPPEVSGKSDVACRFTIRCCGTVVQRWTHSYPQAAGPSGVVLYDTVQTELRCKPTPTPLGLTDLDGDGTPNIDDANPWTAGGGGYPWERDAARQPE
jgi:hypothetical protein